MDPGDDYEYWSSYIKNGPDGTSFSNFRKDAFSEALYYYDGDFTRMNSPFNTNTSGSYPANPELIRNNTGSPNRELYDGNIAAAQSDVIAQPTTGTPATNVFDRQMGYRYEYDELNRLKRAISSHQYSSLAWIPISNTTPGAINDQYTETFQFDKFGMTHIQRNTARNTGADGTLPPRIIDGASLHRWDIAGKASNRVKEVLDTFFKDVTGLDIPDSTMLDYDATGNVVFMRIRNYDTIQAGDTPPPPALLDKTSIYITWNVQNKVSHIGIRNHLNLDTTSITYLYDAMGNKAKQTVDSVSAGITHETWYIRAADGEEMAIYESDASGDPVIAERYLYGRDRIGFMKGANPVTLGQATDLPDMNFEMKEHSGNVRVVIPEVPSTTGQAVPNALSVSHYYAYGGLQAYRNYQVPDYRMGYNGQERQDMVMGLER